jgi:hypothetical protein
METAGDYRCVCRYPQVHRNFIDFYLNPRIVSQILGKYVSGSYAKGLDRTRRDHRIAIGCRKVRLQVSREQAGL